MFCCDLQVSSDLFLLIFSSDLTMPNKPTTVLQVWTSAVAVLLALRCIVSAQEYKMVRCCRSSQIVVIALHLDFQSVMCCVPAELGNMKARVTL